MLATCGSIAESRPLFQHIAGELARALADIEAMCTFGVCAGGISTENVYLAEGGTRLTLRGIRWGPAILPSSASASAALAQRSDELLRSFGRIMRAMLPAPARSGAAAHQREILMSDAEYGITMFLGESVVLETSSSQGSAAAPRAAHGSLEGLPVIFSTAHDLSAPSTEPSSAAAAASAHDGDFVWQPPRVAAAANGAACATARWADDGGAGVRVGSGAACPSIFVSATAVGNSTLWIEATRGDASVESTRCVPLCVLDSAPSPVLSAIVEATDAQQEDSAAIATLRLLSLLTSGDGNESNGATEGFSRVARRVAAVLGFNSSPTAPGDSDEAEADGTGAHDADALAALVCALEEADASLPSGFSGVPGEDLDAGGELKLGVIGGTRKSRSGISCFGHLARHPFFADASSSAAAEDFVAYSSPLRLKALKASAVLAAL